MGKTYCKNCDRLTEWTKDGLCPSCRRGEPPQSSHPLCICTGRPYLITNGCLVHDVVKPVAQYPNPILQEAIHQSNDADKWCKAAAEAHARIAELERDSASWQHDYLKARAAVDRLKDSLSNMALKHGGKNAGHAYGPANCADCKKLTNDYFLVGKAQLCLECYEQFPRALAERERLKRELENAKTLWARSIEQVCEEQTEALRLREALDNIAAAIPDEQVPEDDDAEGWFKVAQQRKNLARQALEAHSPVGNADAPAPPDMSMKQEKSDTLAGHVDAGDTSASCSETAGTKPTCALTPEQVRRLEDEASKAAAEQGCTDSDDGCTSASNEELAFIAGAKWALKDSGWRG